MANDLVGLELGVTPVPGDHAGRAKIGHGLVVAGGGPPDVGQEVLGPHPVGPGKGGADRAPGDVGQYLSALGIEAERLGAQGESPRPEMMEQGMNGRRPRPGRTVHRVANPDDQVQLAAGKGRLPDAVERRFGTRWHGPGSLTYGARA